MDVKYFVRNVNDMEMVECGTCHGTGKIIGTITSEALEEPVVDAQLSCPACNGTGKVSTGKVIHYVVGVVCTFGEAKVTDNGETMEYVLGFVCDDPQKIDTYKSQNNISSFVAYPGALNFYGKTETLYDTLEEAQAVCDKMQAEWTPELRLVE